MIELYFLGFCQSSGFLKRPLKFEEMSKKLGDFFKFCGPLTISEFYERDAKKADFIFGQTFPAVLCLVKESFVFPGYV